MVCFLASRLSPLASRGLVGAFIFCACLFCSGRVFASDWEVGYSYTPSTSQPGTENGLCAPNASVTKTKSVTVTATVTWKGTGSAPSKVLVDESASASWGATLTIAQNSQTIGEPPVDPNGTMTGSCSTGLTDVTTNVPDPWTNRSHGQSKAGTRETIYTVPTNGILTLPSVTLTATATATTGDGTTGGVSVSVGGYSVTIPNASAHSSAGFTIAPDATLSPGWTAGRIEYINAPSPNDNFDVNTGAASFPGLNVHLEGVGLSANIALTAKQYYEYTGSGTAPDLTLSGSYFVSGDVSLARFSAASSAHYALGEPENDLSGSAPNAQTGLQYSKRASFYVAIGSSPSSPQVVSFLLKASASTQ